MPGYTRRQIAVLLLFVVAAGIGLGVGRWRRAHPELVERLEAFDQQVPTAPATGPMAPVTAVDAPVTAPGAQAPSRRGASPAPSSLKRMQLTAEPADVLRVPIDVNQATVADLRRLPGVGPVLAGRIVQARETDGPFTSVDDLRRVAGVGKAKLDRFRGLVTVSQ